MVMPRAGEVVRSALRTRVTVLVVGVHGPIISGSFVAWFVLCGSTGIRAAMSYVLYARKICCRGHLSVRANNAVLVGIFLADTLISGWG